MTHSQEIFDMLELGILPLDYNDWNFVNDPENPWDYTYGSRETIAKLAVARGMIPRDYDLDLLYNNRYTYAHVLARTGKLPVGFNAWDLKDVLGWTVAHEAALYRNLPADFDFSKFNSIIIDDDHGLSVAEVAAYNGNVPDTFDWSFQKENGETMAHIAASCGTLPKNFSDWTLTGETERPVAFTAAIYNTLPDDFKDWDIRDENGDTVAHVAARYRNLPKDLPEWVLNLENDFGERVGSTPILFKRLPDDFDQIAQTDFLKGN